MANIYFIFTVLQTLTYNAVLCQYKSQKRYNEVNEFWNANDKNTSFQY
jgi:hypothetical protein